MRQQHLGVAALALGAFFAILPAPGFAQHETAADLLDGERAYQASCANCHGPNGDLVPGIDLFRGRFRREMSDDDLVRIIRTGIPNTPMPATNMTAEQAAKIVAYLRSLAAKAGGGGVIAGDAARGRELFHGKGNCTSCHAVAGIGRRVGPDLSTVGTARRTPDLERALLDPQADVQPNHRFYRVVLQDGTTVTGRLLGHDTFTVRMIDADEKLRLFVKSDLRSHGFAESPMPSYRTTMTPQEIADVVSYLSSLRAPQGEGRK
jgi:putative heme-binding domain-containing protein